MDENITLQANTPHPSLNGSDIWKNIGRFYHLGSYDSTIGVNAAVKDILLNKLPNASRGEYQPILCSFLCGAAFCGIFQTYPNRNYGSALVFGYSMDYIRYYRMKEGRVYVSVLTHSFNEI